MQASSKARSPARLSKTQYEMLAAFRYQLRQFLHFSEQAAHNAGLTLSSVEIKPATDGRNDPASESCIRCDEKRGIFLPNKPDTNELRRVWLEEKCRLTQIRVAGSFRP